MNICTLNLWFIDNKILSRRYDFQANRQITKSNIYIFQIKKKKKEQKTYFKTQNSKFLKNFKYQYLKTRKLQHLQLWLSSITFILRKKIKKFFHLTHAFLNKLECKHYHLQHTEAVVQRYYLEQAL